MSGSFWQGERVRLRAIEPADWETHFEWNQDSEMSRRLDYLWPPSSKESVRRWAEETSRKQPHDDQYTFEIENLNGEHVGLITTHTCDRRTGTFSYGLGVRDRHQRRGYASEAIRLVLRYFFEELRYQKCTVHVYSFNEQSLGLHDRAGFVREGTMRRMVYTGGQFHDVVIFGMTAEEFAAQTEPKREFTTETRRHGE